MDAAGFVVLFWMGGVGVLWLVVFFLSYADVNGEHTDGPKMIRMENALSPLLYAYTLPVVVSLVMYSFVRYSCVWQWFWVNSIKWDARVVPALLVFDILIATILDLIYPFSYISIAVCVYCLWNYFIILIDGRRIFPTIGAKGVVEVFSMQQNPKSDEKLHTTTSEGDNVTFGTEGVACKAKKVRHAKTGWVI